MAAWLLTPPSTEPISLAEARLHLRIDESVTNEDALVQSLVTATRQWGENFTGRAFITQTWQEKLDRFCGRLVLPKAPVASVTSITYLDTTGATQTLSSSLYRVSLPTGPFAGPATIEPEYGETWPMTRAVDNAVTVTYVAGYGAKGADVPAAILAALKLRLGTLYEHREGVVVGTIASSLPPTATDEYLLWPFKVFP